ncbi:MAG: tetratricopeptide repeat protein [Pyrinomonadaceae bacterium]|nr:tetratricopeptide repeat protein [Pyrinomonadaceae bacterium]
MVGKGKIKDAIKIFKLNVELFPNAFNPHDSLGAAYLKDGNKELALINYKKSVELNPENTGGIKAMASNERDQE